MSNEFDVQVGDLVTWSASFGKAMSDEVGVVIQFEDCKDDEPKLPDSGPCRVWVLWNGKTKMAWTLPEMLKRVDKPVQN